MDSKRIFDLAFSTVVMLLLLPVSLLLLLLLFVFQKPPYIYKQERIGKAGKPFLIYKFRSMNLDSENDGKPRLSSRNDDRETILGRYLRRHHLDEIPQLWNVMKGDMSVVGPRPERLFYINKILEFNSRYKELYQVRPGLTSYATLHNGYTDTMEKMLIRLDMDLEYLDKQSFAYDLRIIVDTVVRMIIGEKKIDIIQ